MRTQTTTIYKFDELSDEAKQIAIDGNRSWNVQDFEWWESSFDSFAEAADLFGLDIRQTVNPGAGRCFIPTIFFSGFSSQGDGACFEGEYAHKKGALGATKQAFPADSELLCIVRETSKPYNSAIFTNSPPRQNIAATTTIPAVWTLPLTGPTEKRSVTMMKRV